MYYDDRDYYNSENIDELYDDNYLNEDNEDDSDDSWEFDYRNLTEELIDE